MMTDFTHVPGCPFSGKYFAYMQLLYLYFRIRAEVWDIQLTALSTTLRCLLHGRRQSPLKHSVGDSAIRVQEEHCGSDESIDTKSSLSLYHNCVSQDRYHQFADTCYSYITQYSVFSIHQKDSGWPPEYTKSSLSLYHSCKPSNI